MLRIKTVIWASLGLAALVGSVFAVRAVAFNTPRSDPDRVQRLAGAILPGAEPASQPDWPQWRGPARDGCSPDVGLMKTFPTSGPKIVWKEPVGRGFSSVAISGGRLFTMGQEEPMSGRVTEVVVCRDAQTGREIWKFAYPNGFEERFGSGPRSTPTVDDGLVYAVGPTGIFHCLRADTGAKVWRHDLATECHTRPSKYGVSFSPLVDGDLVYATPGGPDGDSIVAFDKRSGAVVWKGLDDPVGYSSPLVVECAGVRQLLYLSNAALVSLSPETGRVFWRFPWEVDNGFNIATPIAFGNYVFLSSAYNKGCALLEISASAGGTPSVGLVYANEHMRNHFATSVRQGDYVYGFDRTELVCLSLRTGEIAWREGKGRKFQKGTLIAADGKLIVMCESGHLLLVDASPAGYHETASFRVTTTKCWTTPALADGRLYLRDESELTCIDLRQSAEQ
jgi:outer membrane protein assembly factor BamB